MEDLILNLADPLKNVSSLMLIDWRPQHHFSEDMVLSMRSSIICFWILSLDTKCLKAFLAIVEIKALIALVSHICYGHYATPITFDRFFYCLARFHDDLNAMIIC